MEKYFHNICNEVRTGNGSDRVLQKAKGIKEKSIKKARALFLSFRLFNFEFRNPVTTVPGSDFITLIRSKLLKSGRIIAFILAMIFIQLAVQGFPANAEEF